MALHRDIHWIGRQWAVTGCGMQVINQKLSGKFDVEIARLWDDDLEQSLREQKWFNADDFKNGLAVARARWPAPPGYQAKPLPAESVQPNTAAGSTAPYQMPAGPAKPEIPKAEAVQPPPPAAPAFQMMRIIGCSAKFVQPWHVRIRRLAP